MIRHPAVAGYFYPAEPEPLKQELDHCLAHQIHLKQKSLGIVVPHAGYDYSGAVAGEVYGQIEIPDRIVILCPNHTGEGETFAIMSQGSWLTPLGEVSIDEELASRFKKQAPLLTEDSAAHLREHALEVQLPFLQYLKKSFRFVPVCLSYVSLDRCRQIGLALAKIIQETKEPVLIIASSDMNHHENQKITEAKDSFAIQKIEALDPEGLHQTVQKQGVSMCGIIPATVMLIAAKELGASKAQLIRHATSGDVTKDYSSVVGYAGLVVS